MGEQTGGGQPSVLPASLVDSQRAVVVSYQQVEQCEEEEAGAPLAAERLWLPLPPLLALHEVKVACPDVEPAEDVLELDPLAQVEGRGRAGPVQQHAKLVQERDGAVDLTDK